jgi:hypothetical protein
MIVKGSIDTRKKLSLLRDRCRLLPRRPLGQPPDTNNKLLFILTQELLHIDSESSVRIFALRYLRCIC